MGAALAQLWEIAPRDALEGMLAVEMVSAHSVAMALMRKGVTGDRSLPEAEHYLKYSLRLMHLFGNQLELLNRYRARGTPDQVVAVDQVHVHSGGQAVVGNIVRSSDTPVDRRAESENA
jgi:hypothetical protein